MAANEPLIIFGDNGEFESKRLLPKASDLSLISVKGDQRKRQGVSMSVQDVRVSQ